MWMRMLSTETSMRFFILSGSILAFGPPTPFYLNAQVAPRVTAGRTYHLDVPKGRRGRLILIDAHSLIYRAFFALPPMSTSQGEVTNAAYGFTSMLAIVLASRPEFAAAAFDVGGPNFRSEEYADYKAGRRPMPDDLRPQIERTREVLGSLAIPIYGVEGYEADDVIGTL